MNDITTERAGPSASLTWYGQAGFRLAAGNSQVLIDPFLTGRPDRRYEPPAAAADFADVTLVLCTHEHVDHLDLPFLREFCAVNSAARVVVPLPVVEVAAAGGIDRARLVGAVPGEELHDRDVTVHPVPALHGIGGDEPVVYEFAPDGGPVRFLGYVLEVRGIGGNMNETEAAWLCAQVGPSYVIPMHYECIAGNTGSPGHFTTLIRDSETPATVLAPARATHFIVALP